MKSSMSQKTKTLRINKVSLNSTIISSASEWFHSKWGIPREAYEASMKEALEASAYPEWYVVTDGERIVAGAGVIENDFHNRKDLAPNVCAVFVEKAYRGRGIAGELLSFIADDMKNRGIDTLYLLTDHTSFYERYGWQYLCEVVGDGEAKASRMYIHRAN